MCGNKNEHVIIKKSKVITKNAVCTDRFKFNKIQFSDILLNQRKLNGINPDCLASFIELNIDNVTLPDTFKSYSFKRCVHCRCYHFRIFHYL